MKKALFTTVLLSAFLSLSAQNASQWRGANSNGKYEAPNLLESWPESGPELLWTFEGLGKGHTSPVFANGKIYLTGMIEDDAILFILNMDGSLEKQYNYGKEWDVNFPGTRSSPTVVGDLVYIYTGVGTIVCLDLKDGSIVWTKGLTDFGGDNLRFGVTESLIVDGDVVYYTPGGSEKSIVALNRMTGEEVWASKAMGETSAYCTPRVIKMKKRKIIVTHTKENVIGVDTKSGELLWNYPHINKHGIHPNTVIVDDASLLCFSGYGKGCVRLDMNKDGSEVTKVWEIIDMDNQMGGAIILDGYVYGSGMKARGWHCIDWATGELKYKSTDLGNGVIIMAADKFILYTDKGELVLVNPSSEKLDVISQTKVSYGSAQHWAHPVVSDGVLYVRHGDVVGAYKISK